MPPITASDLDPAVLDTARRNARAAGVRISFKEADVRELRGLQPPLTIVTNPPYGIRLAAAGDFFRDLGTAFSRLHGCRLGLLAGCPELTKIVPVMPAAEFDLYNGDIPCRFQVYEIP
jgi:23S rRNA G2445 N2-methylase RlmL